MKITHNYSGKSLLELREQYGTGASGFYNNKWWLNEKFAKEKPPKGTYEIELHNSFNKTFDEQKAELKDDFEVVHPAILAEAILKHYKKTGKRLAENYWYRCSSVASDGYRVDVGYFGVDGLGVISFWDDFRYDLLGLAASRKFLKSRKLEPIESLENSILEINGVKYKLVKI